MKGATERYYDVFGRRFVRDYVLGNRRVERQLAFLASAIPPATTGVLVIGCGAGESARFVAAKVARRSHVLATDISGENLRLARALHPHPRVTYKKLDILTDDIDGTFEVVVLPDVYEHIPVARRPILHAKLDRLLCPDGLVLLTLPSPGKQAALAAAGQGLQLIDEVVTQQDLMTLAADIHGDLTYLNLISVWEAHDYIHAAIGRGRNTVAALKTATRLSRQSGSHGLLGRIWQDGKTEKVARRVRGAFRHAVLRFRVDRGGENSAAGTRPGTDDEI
jgi:SAM-dependent methyltransferase